MINVVNVKITKEMVDYEMMEYEFTHAIDEARHFLRQGEEAEIVYFLAEEIQDEDSVSEEFKSSMINQLIEVFYTMPFTLYFLSDECRINAKELIREHMTINDTKMQHFLNRTFLTDSILVQLDRLELGVAIPDERFDKMCECLEDIYM